jgi:hypothetical protein
LATITGPSTGSITVPLTADGLDVVRSWVENPSENFGLIIQNFDDVSGDALEFASNNHSEAALRPNLVVVFIPPSEIQPLTNPHNQYDVNDDGAVSPGDALVVINRLNGREVAGEGTGEEDRPALSTYPDVSGDGIVAPFDVLLIINYLNTYDGESGEGESGKVRQLPNEFSLDYAFSLLDPILSFNPQFLPFDSVVACGLASSVARIRSEHIVVIGQFEDVGKESSEPLPELEMSGEDLERTARRNERLLVSRRAAVFADWPDRFWDESEE